ncbi:hypothetical protein LCGC14_0016520 [marine sediment metagenome]|uniref:VWFA domain-containing protein n=1 Tax=marine sediment metagenome TaxID=412755 RepID=A0A0F9W1I6_9ZZZZ
MLGAISLLSPWMLAGAGLMGLPILAHLLSRRARRRIVFPTTRLLLASRASTSRLFRLRRWLVLFLRCLAVAMIVAAFARPTWFRHRAHAAGADEAAAIVMIVDTSASMSARNEGTTVFHRLQALADRTLNSVQPGRDRLGLVIASARPRAVLPELTGEPGVIRRELKRLSPTQQRADFPAAIASAASLLRQHSGPRRLVILSDFQERNWSDLVLSERPGDVLPEDTVITLVPVGGEENDNVALSRPWSSPLRPLVGQPVNLRVQVSNYSPHQRTVSVQFRLDGADLDTRQVDLDPWVSTEINFQARLDRAGVHEAAFAIGRDQLVADNEAFLIVEATSRLQAVVIGDDPPNEPGTSSYFLIRALAPRGDEGDVIAVRHLDSSEVDYGRIADAEAVLVAQVGPLPKKALEALHAFLRRGGGVAVFCGEGPVAENLTRLARLETQTPLLPWTPTEARDLRAEGGVIHLAGDHWDEGVLPGFDADSREALQHVPIYYMWTGEKPQESARVVLRYTDGTPALACQAVGPGRLALCNFSPSLDCSEMGKYGGFVALVQTLFEYLRPSQEGQIIADVGRPLTILTRPSQDAGDDWQVFGPADKRCAAEILTDGPLRFVHVARPDEAGFYRIRRGETPVTSAAVNVHHDESDLRRMQMAVLQATLTGGQSVMTVEDANRSDAILEFRGRPLWHLFLLGGLIAIGLELVVLAVWKQ